MYFCDVAVWATVQRRNNIRGQARALIVGGGGGDLYSYISVLHDEFL